MAPVINAKTSRPDKWFSNPDKNDSPQAARSLSSAAETISVARATQSERPAQSFSPAQSPTQRSNGRPISARQEMPSRLPGLEKPRIHPTIVDGKYGCNLCSIVPFAKLWEWNKHIDKHDRPYVCKHPDCSNSPGFTFLVALSRHEREVHKLYGGAKLKLFCPHEDCKRHQKDRPFARQENLNLHLKRVHESVTEKPAPVNDNNSQLGKSPNSLIVELVNNGRDGLAGKSISEITIETGNKSYASIIEAPVDVIMDQPRNKHFAGKAPFNRPIGGFREYAPSRSTDVKPPAVNFYHNNNGNKRKRDDTEESSTTKARIVATEADGLLGHTVSRLEFRDELHKKSHEEQMAATRKLGEEIQRLKTQVNELTFTRHEFMDSLWKSLLDWKRYP